MRKACIFDLDGTLADTLDSLTYSVNETLREMGLGAITSEQCKAYVGNGSRVLIERSLETGGDAGHSRIEEAMGIYGRVFAANCNYHVKPYVGIVSAAEQMKRRGLHLAVLSNKPHLQAIDVVETAFGRGFFAVIQGQCEGIPRKPDLAGARRILEYLRVSPDEVLYVGDSEVDMKTGKAAGFLTVGVEWGFRTREVLERSGADAVIAHADELLTFLD